MCSPCALSSDISRPWSLGSAHTLDTHGLNTLIRASCVLLKAGDDLARPACRKPGNERRCPRDYGEAVTTRCWAAGLTTDRVQGARSLLGPTSSLAAPSSSDRIGRTQ